MKPSIVRQAAEAFQSGQYAEAFEFYKQASSMLGENMFWANIRMCEQRLWRTQGGRDYAQIPLAKLRVACVMDEFTYHSYAPECELFQLTPDHVIQELETFNPDLLFIESAWRGKDDLWDRKIATLSQELRSALQWCKSKHIPTMFWNKEDPVHFDTFLTMAQQFDHVFTTDIDCIARYKAAFGHQRVYFLPFACQPKTHNPIELYERKDAFCFAGAYYVRYPERTIDLENFVKEFPKFRPLEIFDRNFGKEDSNYQFPDTYQPYIVGTLPFNEIDKAYKGYNYSINLNSVKQSQTMFARRVYELLGSNTLTVSNFSRGIRVMFGDLVLVSDSGQEIVQRLQSMDTERSSKHRLAGLRKVMLEHSYGQRLSYIASKTLHRMRLNPLPSIVVLASVKTVMEFKNIVTGFLNQSHEKKRLVIIIGDAVDNGRMKLNDDPSIKIINEDKDGVVKFGELVQQGDWISLMHAEDYYGENYLLDLAIATLYTNKGIIGKKSFYQSIQDEIQLTEPNSSYQESAFVAVRSSIISASQVDKKLDIKSWINNNRELFYSMAGLSIDPFNYCKKGWSHSSIEAIKKRVDDEDLDVGVSIDELILTAEQIPPAQSDESSVPTWDARKLMELTGKSTNAAVKFEVVPEGFRVQASLEDGKHQYIYSKVDLPLSQFTETDMFSTHMDNSPGLNLQYVFVFLDNKKQKISHSIHTGNRNHKSVVPENTTFVRLGWRVMGTGVTTVKMLMWGHRQLAPERVLGRSDVLVLTNNYPTYDDLYKNGFVHSRVVAYAQNGVNVDVFRLRKDETHSFHEFSDVDVITGSQEVLHRLLTGGHYKSVLVHFLDAAMWEVLQHYIDKIKVTVWVHGAEIQPWHRREYNYENDDQRKTAILESDVRMKFWQNLLGNISNNLKFVFVSKYFSEEVMHDQKIKIQKNNFKIIHNPIDTDLFSFVSKDASQRKRILSIRPFASRQYANDLSVQAILALSKKPWFKELEFRIIGDGKLFDETLAPLRHFENVIIEQRFLKQSEIAQLHKDYGIFLCPTRWDSHGVSRDEAMSSGLIPVTNAVAAIPEFVDERCGFTAPGEDWQGLADAIARMYDSPELFSSMSKSASQRVRKQSNKKFIIEQEMNIFNS